MSRPITKCRVPRCLCLAEYSVVFSVPLTIGHEKGTVVAPFTLVSEDGVCEEHQDPHPRTYYTDDQWRRVDSHIRRLGFYPHWKDISVQFNPVTFAAQLKARMHKDEFNGVLDQNKRD